MESVIERITRGHFWKFHGGVHPPEQKFLTKDKPIRKLPVPEQLILPLQQHIGQPGDLLVSVGDKVLKGQVLTKSTGPMAVPIHAPTSGIVTDIKPAVIAHPSGLSELCLFIASDGEDKWKSRTICENFLDLPKEEIINKIANAGISGMGGAGFPTHIKVNATSEVNFLIINAAECEPYITADDLLIREHSTAIIDGINILEYLLAPAFILVGIEDNKHEAIKALKNAAKHNPKIKICVLPTKYPTGGEKQLIKALTGKEISSGSLPISVGVIVQNIATCFAVADAVINDKPLIHRVITVTGQALDKPQNIWALLGTKVEFLLDKCALRPEEQKHVIMGGPMMGFSLLNDQVPVVKTTNCILAPTEKEIPKESKEVECIRCGQCAEVCPSQLLPQELQWSAKAKDYPQLSKLNLSDCIDCGACAFVCPSQIPLVQYYRVAKAEIKQLQILDVKAEKAKQRFEARKIRLEKEKIAREQKHKKAADARRAAMNKKTSEAEGAKSAVAAALARAKAKKALNAKNANQVTAQDSAATESPADKKSQVAQAVARAKAKKLAADKAKTTEPTNADKAAKPDKSAEKIEAPESTIKTNKLDSASINKASDTNSKKSKVATAVAKAKAKKLAADKAKTTESVEVSESAIETNKLDSASNSKASDADSKKSKVAAAVAKAKAKKLAADKAKAAKSTSATNSVKPTKPNKATEAVKGSAPAIEEDTKKDSKTSTSANKKSKSVATDTNAQTKKTTTEQEKVTKSTKSGKSTKAKKPLNVDKKPVPTVETIEEDTEKSTTKKSKTSTSASKKVKAEKAAAKKITTVEASTLSAENKNATPKVLSDDAKDIDKKSRVAAAVAKAKAKQRSDDHDTTDNDEVKKKRIAEVISKAKSKKLQKQQIESK